MPLRHLRTRLMREDKWDAQGLAEELIAGLSDDETPADFPGGIELSAGEDKEPIKLKNFKDGDTIFKIERGGQPFSSITIVGGNLVIQDGDGVQTGSTGEGDQQEDEEGEEEESSAGGLSAIGVVVSGSGDTYVVDTYPGGVGGEALRVTVKQMQIASDATIPAGTACLVVEGSDGTFAMQVPVWLP